MKANKDKEPESKVSASFAYNLANMFKMDAELYKKQCEELKNKLLHYKQHSIY